MERGVLAEPWSVDTAFSRVDYRDVAEVAAMALTEDRLLYGTFELCAPGWLNRREVATLMSKVVGREIRAERRDPAELGDIPGRMKLMYEYYDTHDLLGNSMTLRALLGREPRSLKEYFKELAAKG
jgi:nucleoside-diphosphate-sugar epimerase